MGRPKPEKVPPNFTARAHRLSDDARKRLIELLCLTHQSSGTHSDPIAAVEKWLGFCKDGDNIIKSIPRTADPPLRGRPKEEARAKTIRELRRIFQTHYRGPRGRRKSKGPVRYRPEQEKLEVEFIYYALSDARIQCYQHELQRIFRENPLCALPEQRADVIERIANKTRPKKRTTE